METSPLLTSAASLGTMFATHLQTFLVCVRSRRFSKNLLVPGFLQSLERFLPSSILLFESFILCSPSQKSYPLWE